MSRRNSLMVRKAYYQMGMVTLFTTLLWVSVSVYLAITSPTEVEVEPIMLTPVSPKIDEATLASISARTQMGILAEDTVRSASPAAGTESAEPEL